MSKKILAFRFSAMGDVAMTVPVLKEVLKQNPDTEIVMVSRPFLKPFFENIPRLTFFGADLNGEHNGFKGLRNLYKSLQAQGPFLAVADIHSVLRTFILDAFFQTSGTKVVRIDKGRKGKKQLTRPKDKVMQPLRPMPERYADVFRKIGLTVELPHQLSPKVSDALNQAELELLGGKNNSWIGIAPFAQHKGKAWGEVKAVALAKLLQEKENAKVIFFGGPGEESKLLDKCVEQVPGSINLAGKIKLKEELDIIEHLDVMVSMDSANMHMASLRGTPTVSVWGATHHYAGFIGYGQDKANIVELSTQELPCRPCSVFGNKPCLREDYACLEEVTPEMVYQRVATVLNK